MKARIGTIGTGRVGTSVAFSTLLAGHASELWLHDLRADVAEAGSLPVERVIGTGTLLDTARLRERLAVRLGLSTQSVHAQVVGEHGDSSVMLWSSARVDGMALRDWAGWQAGDEAALGPQVRCAAYEVIRRKGATNHAIGLVTAELIGCIVNDERRLLPVSRVQPGSGVALSLAALAASRAVLEAAYASR